MRCELKPSLEKQTNGKGEEIENKRKREENEQQKKKKKARKKKKNQGSVFRFRLDWTSFPSSEGTGDNDVNPCSRRFRALGVVKWSGNESG